MAHTLLESSTARIEASAALMISERNFICFAYFAMMIFTSPHGEAMTRLSLIYLWSPSDAMTRAAAPGWAYAAADLISGAYAVERALFTQFAAVFDAIMSRDDADALRRQAAAILPAILTEMTFDRREADGYCILSIYG